MLQTVSDTDVPSLVERDTLNYVSQRAKRPRESCCEDTIKEFKEEIKSMFHDMSANQNLSLKKLIKDVAEIKTQNSAIQKSNQEIEKSLEFLSEQFESVSARVDTLEKQRKEHLLQISSLEAKIEDIQRSLKSTTVEIRNVPVQSKKENMTDLISLVQNTGKALDVVVHANDIKDVFRIKNKSGATTIVTEFTNSALKQEVIKSAKTFNKKHPKDRLNSSHIGVSGNTVPIYISEGLTSKGRRLLFLARDFATSTGYKYCWTANGRVFVRKADDAPYIEIKSEADIANLKNQK